MIVLRLAIRSLLNRWVAASLTVLAIAMSVLLLLGVEKVRTGARASFANTISGTDLIVGARAGTVQLLLYSVFRIGNATNNVTWQTYQDIAARPEVAWMVPISLGDSHRGFRVMGTTADYFRHYRYRRDRPLAFQSGAPFDDLFDAVLGADVAASLGYELGDAMVVAHGLGRTSFAKHDDKPFRVAGILAKTGTPVDRTVHVSLEAITAVHIDWQSGARIPGQTISAEQVREMDLTPNTVTAALIGVKSKLAIFRLQRAINEYPEEPLTAVLPGVALQELWSLIGVAETALGAISAMVVVTALLGMVTMILATLNARRRELAILRAVGARPGTIFALLSAEAGLLALAGTALGAMLLYAVLAGLRPWVDAEFGLALPIDPPTQRECLALAAIVAGGFLVGLLPAFLAYRTSLADGMMVRN
ncbi:MAG: ABC transporter permease [Alphaproteobacteria bacterium]